jgi:hypothetical protein
MKPQRMQALERANHVRMTRSRTKRAIRAGQMDVVETISACPPEFETMSVAELLRAQRRWGAARARKLLRPLAIGENRQLGRLTHRQRGLLAAAVAATRSGAR